VLGVSYTGEWGTWFDRMHLGRYSSVRQLDTCSCGDTVDIAEVGVRRRVTCGAQQRLYQSRYACKYLSAINGLLAATVMTHNDGAVHVY
jgi:hypothetical protein